MNTHAHHLTESHPPRAAPPPPDSCATRPAATSSRAASVPGPTRKFGWRPCRGRRHRMIGERWAPAGERPQGNERHQDLQRGQRNGR